MTIKKYFVFLSLSVLFLPTIVNAGTELLERERMTYPRIIVSSNGETYNDVKVEIKDRKIQLKNYLELDAGRGNVIENFDISTSFKHGIGRAHRVALPRSETYSFIRIPVDQQNRRFERTLTQHINPRPLLGHAQDMCNQVAQSLRQQGKTNREIFSRTRTAFFKVKTIVSAIPSSGLIPILDIENNLYVTCLKDMGIGNRIETNDIPRVKRVNITVGKSTGKTCKLTLSGSILATYSNTNYSYKLMFNGRVLDETYAARSRSNKIARFTHVFPIDVNATTFNETTDTAPKRGTFQIISDDLRSNVARYSINCLLPRINPRNPSVLPGIKPKIKGL